MRKYLISFVGAVLVVLGFSGTALAGTGWMNYKPGIVKSALASGKTTLLFYKSTW